MKPLVRLIQLFCFFIFITTNVVSQDWIGSPDSLTSNADEIIHESKIEFIVHTAKTATYKCYVRATILSAESDLSQVAIYHNGYIKSKWLGGTIVDAKGKTVRRIKNKDFNDIAAQDGFSVFNDSRYDYVEMAYSQYPYTIEYSYQQSYSNLMYYPDWYIQKYNQSVEQATFVLDLPAHLDVSIKPVNTDVSPTIQEDTDRIKYFWQENNLVARTVEQAKLPRVLLAPHQFEGDDWVGSMKNWNEFGKFLFALNDGHEILSENMISTVQDMISDAASDEEKIDILYRYLQDNHRYVSVQIGIGGWRSFDAHYVEKNKYGDCKALSNYMRAMLKAADIPSNLIVIGNGRKIEIDSSFVDPSAFNHMILHVPKKDMFLECTSSDMPPGYVGRGNANRTVLSIQKNGGRLIETPKYGPEKNILIRRDTLKWNDKGRPQINGEQIGQYTQHEIFRTYKNRYTDTEKEEYFLNKFPLPVLQINKLEYFASREKPEGGLRYQVDISKIGSTSGKRKFIPAVPLESINNPLKKDEEREKEYKLDWSFQDETELYIEFPKGYEVEAMPKDVEYTHEDYGTYKIQYTKGESSLIIRRKVTLRPVTIPADEYSSAYDWLQQLERADGQQFVLKEAPNRT